MDSKWNSLEESILKRTVCINPISEECDENMLSSAFGRFGDITDVKIDVLPRIGSRYALLQFTDDDSASRALRHSQLSLGNTIGRVNPARATIEVLPPTDAVFGKPMTVGKHVMAVNPSNLTSEQVKERDKNMRMVNEAAAKVLLAISARSGRIIPDGEIERLVATSQYSSNNLSKPSRHNRSRSRSRHSLTKDEMEWQKEGRGSRRY